MAHINTSPFPTLNGKGVLGRSKTKDAMGFDRLPDPGFVDHFFTSQRPGWFQENTVSGPNL